MVKCLIPTCNNEGTKAITDATYYPERYNGKKLCDVDFEEREYMKTNDIVSSDEILPISNITD